MRLRRRKDVTSKDTKKPTSPPLTQTEQSQKVTGTPPDKKPLEENKLAKPNPIRKVPMDWDDYANLPRCAAMTKSKGTPCVLPAGFRTDHLGTGRCWLHGGRSNGAGKGNLNGLKTGEYQVINPLAGIIDDEEEEIFDSLVIDKLVQVGYELRIITIRERRMMKRIQDLQAAGDMTVVEISTSDQDGYNSLGDLNTHTYNEKQIATLGQIQEIEEALTRVQKQKSTLLELKHKLEQGGEGDIGSLTELVKAIRGSDTALDLPVEEPDGDQSKSP